MLKSYRVGVVVAHVIIVSALGPNSSFFLFWGTFIQLGGLLGQGPGLGLGPGLDNFSVIFSDIHKVPVLIAKLMTRQFQNTPYTWELLKNEGSMALQTQA